MRIAVLGMGRMGQAVAGRLVDRGHDVVIWNRTPGRARELLERGAREADAVGAAVSGVEVVVASLANDEAVADVAWGDDGIRSSLADGAVYLEASTISPALSAQLAEGVARFAAMPILGSPDAVAAGRATYLIGGTAEVIAFVEPVLAALTETVRRYDAAPMASTAKLAVNLLLLDGVVALAESFAVGRAGGLSDDQLRQLLGDSPMVATGLRNRFEGVLTGHQDPWWTAALGAKDAGLAVGLVEAAGAELPLTALARDQYQQAAVGGSDGGDITDVAKLYRA
jgi:3-hydroxyisobutyrate dehydrogenase-like beta-hydroxyacid dehydrogenase